MVTFSAHFDGKFIVPEEPTGLMPGTRLRVTIEPVGAGGVMDTPGLRQFKPLNIDIAPDLSNAIAMDAEFGLQES